MKKLISLILALALVMSLSATAFATESDKIENSGESASVEVTGTYVEGTTASGTVFSVDIAWSGMDFTYYAEKAPVWDATNHKYSETSAAYWKGEGTITVTNHSNAKITAEPAYQAETGYDSATMKFEAEKLNIASAEVGTAQVGTITVTPEGTLPASANGGKIGTITVTIAEDTVKTPLEEAQELQAEIQATYDQVKGQGNESATNQLEAMESQMDVLVQDATIFQESGSWDSTTYGSYDAWNQVMTAVRDNYEQVLDELA